MFHLPGLLDLTLEAHWGGKNLSHEENTHKARFDRDSSHLRAVLPKPHILNEAT